MTVALYRKGPCTVKFAGITIGQTEGDVVFKYSPEWKMFTPDQSLGAQGAFIVSETIECTVPLIPRADALELVHAHAFPAGLIQVTKKTGGGDSSLSAAEAIGETTIAVASGTNFAIGDMIVIGEGLPTAEIRTLTGVSGTDLTFAEATGYLHAAGEIVQELDSDPKIKYTLGNNRTGIGFAELLITPLDGSDPIKIYKALCTGEVELALKKEEETVIELSYMGIEDTARNNGDRLAAIGLQSVA